MQSREGWTRAEAGPKVIKGKTYNNLTEFTRRCSACEKSFSIFVTDKIANGLADSNSFGLRNCDEHRRNKSKVDSAELSALRTANTTMKEELAGLYERVRLQFEEIQVLKAKLAPYDLPEAFELLGMGPRHDPDTATGQRAIGCEPVQNKMPWEG